MTTFFFLPSKSLPSYQNCLTESTLHSIFRFFFPFLVFTLLLCTNKQAGFQISTVCWLFSFQTYWDNLSKGDVEIGLIYRYSFFSTFCIQQKMTGFEVSTLPFTCLEHRKPASEPQSCWNSLHWGNTPTCSLQVRNALVLQRLWGGLYPMAAATITGYLQWINAWHTMPPFLWGKGQRAWASGSPCCWGGVHQT